MKLGSNNQPVSSCLFLNIETIMCKPLSPLCCYIRKSEDSSKKIVCCWDSGRTPVQGIVFVSYVTLNVHSISVEFCEKGQILFCVKGQIAFYVKGQI